MDEISDSVQSAQLPANAEEFETLVLSGGGVKGFQHLGGLMYVFRKQPRFRRFVGSSIGAIILALCLVGYTPLQLMYFFYRIDFMGLGFTLNILRMMQSGGLNSQAAIEALLAGLFLQKGVPANITMRELFERTGVEFEVVVTNLTKFKVEYISHRSHPDMSVLTALLMSGCVPVAFEPVRYRDELFVDGGISNNYPIERYPNSLGLLIVDIDPALPETPDTFIQYMYRLFNYTVFQNVYSKCRRYMDRTILFHNRRKIMPISFWMSSEDKLYLFREGYRLAREFFHRVPAVERAIEFGQSAAAADPELREGAELDGGGTAAVQEQ